MIFQQLRRQSDGIGRRNRAICPNFKRQLVVVSDLPEARGFHGVIAFAHRRVHGINRNEADAQVFIEVLVRRNIAAPALEAHFHVQLAAFADGRDVHVLVEDLNVAIGLDHAAGDHARLVCL